jgi:DNA-binding winged helix-turn-helix (wHTH) protein/TolB-like protein/Tfp pilus assembly protein PilF
MSGKIRQIYEFGEFRLEPAECLLRRDGETVALTAKVFDLLVLLVENRGRLIEKEELLQALWPDSIVEESNLSVNVSALRKALGENPARPQFIETVPRRGYRFVAAVTESAAPAVASPLIATESESANAPANDNSHDQLSSASETTTNVSTPAPLADAKPRPLRSRATRWLLVVGILVAVALAAVLYRVLVQPRSAAGTVRTIAVLPFRTVTGNEDDSALAMGMADALITRLGNLQQISVRPTSAVMKYGGANSDAIAAGRALGVEVVLDGLVQKSDKMIRVSVQMLRVSDGATVWGAKFDDYFTNIFAVQDSISEKIAEQLSLRLSRDEQKLIAKRYTENTEAYQLFMQGRYYHNRSIQDKALSYYQAAIEKDPDYPLPYAGMVGLYLGYANQGVNRQESLAKARASADKALRLAPDLSEAYDSLGDVKMAVDWDFGGAIQAYQKAIELNPQNADTRASYALMCARLGRFDEAISDIQRASQLDPVSVYMHGYEVDFLVDAGRYDEAIEAGKKAVAFDPEYTLSYYHLARAYTAKGMYDEAMAVLQNPVALKTNRRLNIYAAYILARAGRRAEATSLLNQYEQDENFRKVPYGYFLRAVVNLALGERDRALALLEEGVKERAADMMRLNTALELNDLRAEPRFQSLLKRVGF